MCKEYGMMWQPSARQCGGMLPTAQGGLARIRTGMEVVPIGKSNSRHTRKEILTRAHPGRQRRVKMTSGCSCSCSWG